MSGVRKSLGLPLLSRAMFALLAAQFFSAMGDNVVLVTAIALVKSQGQPGQVPWLQDAFVVPYILLAPFVGTLADAFPKGAVMLVSNLAKLAGAIAMTLGLNPLLAYGGVGIGAAMYSPAKYGILTQMFGPAQLVRANGMIEGSTIVAVLAGAILGGWLADHSLLWAYGGVMACYGLASLANLLIPRLDPETPGATFHFWTLLLKFRAGLALLFRNRDGRFSLLGTSLFWGSGTTLRLLLFAWVPVALMISDNKTPALMMAAVSVGIVLGAGAAGMWISLERVNRALIGGLLIGPAVMAMALVHSLLPAGLLMMAIGVCGGLFVVPLNALLQERGHHSIGAGNALAVQNFAENASMLLFVSLYGGAMKIGAPVTGIASGFGLLLLVLIGVLALFRLRGAGADEHAAG